MANPNLIKQAMENKKQTEHQFPKALVISLAIIGLSVVVYLGFFLVTFLFDGQVSDVQAKIDQENADLASLKDEAVVPQSFVERLQNLSKLASDHVYLTGILNDIAARTDKHVQYTSFSSDVKTNVVSLQGRASDLAAVERNVVSLTASKNVLHAKTSNVTYAIDSRTQIASVTFDLKLELRSGVFTTLPDTIQLKTEGAK
jgi:Tfp pilus assembly protein PilN